MAGNYGHGQFQQNMGNVPHPIQTQNHPRAYSPQQYHQSPGAMSPTTPGIGGIPPAKRQRISPNPPSPYGQPYANSPYAHQSPYSASAASPPQAQYLSLPTSPATTYPAPSFHQPQPYHHPNDMNSRPPQGSMPPPKIPYSKAQDNTELEAKSGRDTDVNAISDVLTGSGIDLRAEEEALTSFNRNTGTSFNNSQGSGATISPHGSFNNWSQAGTHGAFQGTGSLSQPVTKEQQEKELRKKYEDAARVLNASAESPLSDPFLQAGILRGRISQKAYANGVGVNLEGLFDKIPEVPQNVTRTTLDGSNGESIVKLQADSLLNQNAPFVEVLSLVSLAAEDRLRTILEDAFALAQGRRATSHGVVPPDLVDLATAQAGTVSTSAAPINITKTAWDAPESAVSPMTVSANKHPSAGRLPTPPTEAPPTPQPTKAFPNPVAAALKRRLDEDIKWEKERIAKRQKRQQGNSATPAETPAAALVNMDDAALKKNEREQKKKAKVNQTDDVLHAKANETASMALFGGKKKYSWMTGGGGGGGLGSGRATPKLNTAVGSSGTATPAQPQVDRALQGARRKFGEKVESGDKKIQLRDLLHVLENDGRERKTQFSIKIKHRP